MASPRDSNDEGDQRVPDEEATAAVKSIQSHYLRCPSPTFSMMSDRFSTMSDRFSMISGSDAESIFMDPIHLSSTVAAKQIIKEELGTKEVRLVPTPDSMLETAEQLMVEDLYNRVKDMIDDRSPYNTPCVLDIQRALVQDRLEAPLNPMDEVWPNIFIGEKSVAVNKSRLKRLGVTHILNAGHGTGVYTGEVFYTGMNITYMGIEIDDFADSDISPYFRSAAEFLDEALLTHRGKVLVDSMMGVSRSAALVAAYLMIFQHMTIMEALTTMRKKRPISPNEGFLKQLRQLNENLLEERDDDDDDTLSQCSVIDTHARRDEEESMLGVKAHSIMVEEEEDGASVMSSVASSAAAAALKAGLLGDQNALGQTRAAEDPALPGKAGEDEDEGDVGGMIREWQRRNEKYQSDDWWEAQLLSDGEDDASLPGGGKRLSGDDDLDSVTSEDIRAVKERLKRRPRRPNSDSVSTASCSSYADIWKQRLKEIEEQAAARYRVKDQEEGGDDESSEKCAKKIDDDVESLLSDSSSMYNFCKKNKENMTALERWRIKRIQFGWNKKDAEAEKGGADGEQKEGDAKGPTPALEDVNLTAYQSWKLKQQKKYGGEENKDEIVELSRGEDSATAKRRQRREEVLERSKKTLEESQSMCGWDTESSLSSIPFSAFCAGAFPSPSVAGDDNISMLSGRSSVLSQARSTQSQTPAPSIPQTPMPVPTMQGPNGEPMVNIANIQNWIANVVTETLMQKQGEMMMGASLPPSRAGSVFSRGAGSNVGPGRSLDDDKASMLSGASYSSSLPRGRAESVLSAGGASNLSSVSGLGSRRSKITTTSVPLYSLFQDMVNLRKLDSMDKEIKSEMRDKMATYEVKKIAEDNKRSTLYKKKKPKEEEEEEGEEEFGPLKLGAKSSGYRPSSAALTRTPERKKKFNKDYGLSGRLNLPAGVGNQTTSIDEWLKNVRPPSGRTTSNGDGITEAHTSRTTYGTDPDSSEYDFSSPRTSYTTEAHEGEDHGIATRFSSKYCNDTDTDLSGDPSPEPRYQSRRSPPATESFNSLSESRNYRTGRSYVTNEEEEEEENYQDYTAKRKITHYSRHESGQTEGRGRSREADKEEEDVTAFINRVRQRCRAQAEEELEDDDVIGAWRKQEESRSHTNRRGDS